MNMITCRDWTAWEVNLMISSALAPGWHISSLNIFVLYHCCQIYNNLKVTRHVIPLKLLGIYCGCWNDSLNVYFWWSWFDQRSNWLLCFFLMQDPIIPCGFVMLNTLSVSIWLTTRYKRLRAHREAGHHILWYATCCVLCNHICIYRNTIS